MASLVNACPTVQCIPAAHRVPLRVPRRCGWNGGQQLAVSRRRRTQNRRGALSVLAVSADRATRSETVWCVPSQMCLNRKTAPIPCTGFRRRSIFHLFPEGVISSHVSSCLVSKTSVTSKQALPISSVHFSLVSIYVPNPFFYVVQHTSASLTINENASPDVPLDLNVSSLIHFLAVYFNWMELQDTLDRMVPESSVYRHDEEGADDMPAHVKVRCPHSAKSSHRG